MISKEMQARLADQMNLEFQSAYHYFALSAYCTAQNMTGFAKWMMVQAQEEIIHGMKIYDYLNDQGADVALKDIKQPVLKVDSMLDTFRESLANEERLTVKIQELVAFALEEKDYATHTFLQWFVTEQVEEVATCTEILEQLKMVEGDGNGLLLIDRELKQRELEYAYTVK